MLWFQSIVASTCLAFNQPSIFLRPQ